MAHADDHIVTPRPAATVVLARDGGDGLEVLLLQRTHAAVFLPGVFVFPGGAVDESDHDPRLAARAGDLDVDAANRLIGVDEGGMGYIMAALRECFEEAGLLLADGAGDAELGEWRRRLVADEVTFSGLCETLDLRLHADRVVYLSHWITPPGSRRRFDTRFLLAPAPPGQTASHDGDETIDHVWVHPGEALERNRRGEFPLGSPTMRTLRTLAAFERTEELLAQTRLDAGQASDPGTPELGARTAGGRDGPRAVHHEEPAYAEIVKLQDEGIGEGSYELLPGVPRRLSERITRLTAPNPGMMTGPGTNTYLIDCGEGTAVIDPGPDLAAHLDAIVEAAGGAIRWILTTHTHPDHSPGAGRLKTHTGAEVLGMPPPAGDIQDRGFKPDRVPAHGDRLRLGDVTLRTIHTPGHASNHLCYLLEAERLLFSGDHIMQGSTVVISPPDGHMADYLHSLDALHGEDLAWIAPGHGFLMNNPDAVIEKIVHHRIDREKKVLRAMQHLGDATPDELLEAVYNDVPSALHRVAYRSLMAHLIKLADDGLLEHTAERFALKS